MYATQSFDKCEINLWLVGAGEVLDARPIAHMEGVALKACNMLREDIVLGRDGEEHRGERHRKLLNDFL